MYCSSGRSSPSFQLLVINPVFFMRVRKDTIISFPINFFASAFLDIKNHCIVTSNRNYTIRNYSIFRHDNFIGCFSADKIKMSARK